jgi:hypothetical protein
VDVGEAVVEAQGIERKLAAILAADMVGYGRSGSEKVSNSPAEQES